MKHYVGLDVAMKETAICIVNDERRVVREGNAPPRVAFRFSPQRRRSGCKLFAAQYSARVFPCQRFAGGLTAAHA
jgi:hypothetical protein